MVAGRPRTTSFSEDEMIKLGQEMVKWVEEHRPLHLKQWYSIEKEFLYGEWKTFIQRKEFIPYYEKALAIVSLQYIQKDSDIKDGVSHRFLRLYFKDLKEEEDFVLDCESDRKKSEMEHAVKLRKEEVLSYTEEQAERHKCLLDMLKEYQSALLSDSTSSSTESKS